jgi:hypothetical protein
MRIYAMPSHLLGDPVVQAGELQKLVVGALAYYVKPGYGLVIAEWVEEKQYVQVTALGEVREVNEEGETIVVELIPFERTLTPSGAGKGHWRKTRRMCLDVSLVKKYELIDDFCSCFANGDFRKRRLSDSTRDRVNPDPNKPSLNPRDGFVYLFKGSDLYKIGMAEIVERRKVQVEKDCGEKLETVHVIRSSDHFQTERDMHVKYAAKRVKGEWFDLSPEEVAEFCSISELLTDA